MCINSSFNTHVLKTTEEKLQRLSLLKIFFAEINRMRLSLVIIFSLFIIKSVISETRLSCDILGNTGCLLSCNAQNCATGTCNSNKVCICDRCGNGSIIGKRETFKNDSKGISCNYLGSVGCSGSCLSQGFYCGGTCNSANTCVCNPNTCIGK